MFCRKCGKEIDENILECPYCGCNVIALENDIVSEKEDISSDEPIIENDSPISVSKPRNKKIIKWILLGLLCAGM